MNHGKQLALGLLATIAPIALTATGSTSHAQGGPALPDISTPGTRPPKPTLPHVVDDPQCAVIPEPSGPEHDELVFTGSRLEGVTTVFKVGSVYSLRFDGDETIEYQLDLADPDVAKGLLRIYEAQSDSFPVAEGGPGYRDSGGTVRDAKWLSAFTVLASDSADADSVTLVYEDHVDGVHRRAHHFQLVGKSLRVRVYDLDANLAYKSNYSGLKIGKTEGTENPSLVRMQGTLANPIALFEDGAERYYYANQLDLLWSNASDWDLAQGDSVVPTPTSVEFAYTTLGLYDKLTNGKLAAPLDDTFNLIVASRIEDVLVDSTAKASPYRESMASRTGVIFTGGTSDWAEFSTELTLFHAWGMRDLAGYFFAWWSSSNNGDAWHYPAKSEVSYLAMRNAPEVKEFLLGEYAKYWKNWSDSPMFSIYEIPLNSSGFPKGDQIAETARLRHALTETPLLKEHYDSSLVYQDVLTYASPTKGIGTNDLDQNAVSPWAKTLRQGCIDRKVWLEASRDIMDGPMLGEASIATQNSNMEWLWYGYVDSVQRTINSGGSWVAADLPYGDPHAVSLWPIIPEYELRVVATKMTNHGNAFYQRFFSWADEDLFPSGVVPTYPLPQAAQDRYRAYAVTYGHGAFFQTNGPFNGVGDYLYYADMLREHFLLNGLQRRMFASPVTSIRYPQGGQMKTFDEVLFTTGTTDTFIDARVRIEYANGLVVLVNHNPNPWDLAFEGLSFTLPEDSFYAYNPATPFVAFSAIPNELGKRIDYSLVPNEYEFFDGRGVIGGYGGLTTANRLLKVHQVAFNRTLTEEVNGGITIENGPAPVLETVQVTLTDYNVQLGEKVMARAIGIYSNGGRRDLTRVTGFVTDSPNRVKIRESGAISTHCIGQATITPFVDAGVVAVPAVLTIAP